MGFDDVSTVAVLQRLTNLQHLHVATSDVGSPLVLAAAADLTGLRRLYVHGKDEDSVQDRELLLLTRLTQLSYLNLRRNECTDSGWQTLVLRLPQLAAVLDCHDYNKYRDTCHEPILEGLTNRGNWEMYTFA